MDTVARHINFDFINRTFANALFGKSSKQKSSSAYYQSIFDLVIKKYKDGFEQRKFGDHKFVALFIDGKYMAGDQMVTVLGVSDKGEKIPLGIVQTNTENANSIGDFGRGLQYEDGLPCVIDGAKGIRKAVEDVFGDTAVIQRCQWHERENVVGHLNEDDKEKYRSKLQKAYYRETYKEAKEKT